MTVLKLRMSPLGFTAIEKKYFRVAQNLGLGEFGVVMIRVGSDWVI